MRITRFWITLCSAALVLVGCVAKTVAFRSETGNFSVSAPALLTEHVQSFTATGGKVDAHTYLAESDGILYVAAYSVFSAETISQGDPEKFLNTARDSMVASVNGQLLQETGKPLGNFPGRELEIAFTDADGVAEVMRARVYLIEDRLYQVMVLADKADRYDRAISRFLDSFKLLEDH